MVEVRVNDVRKEVNKGTTVKELLEELGLKVDDKMLIARKEEEKKSEIKKYVFDTGMGTFVGNIDIEEWRTSYKTWKGVEVNLNLSDGDKVVFGPAKLDVKMSHAKKVKRKKGDVFLLKSSPDAGDTFLCFAISSHEDVSLVSDMEGKESEEGRIGRVEAGFSSLKNIGIGIESGGGPVVIKNIQPEYKTEKILRRMSPYTSINEEMTIYSHLAVKLFPEAPISAESFFLYLKNNDQMLRVDENTHTYVMASNPAYFELKPENNVSFREKGSVLVRNEGERKNSIFIYKEHRMPQQSLNKIGKLEGEGGGKELLSIAKEGDRIAVRTIPTHVSVVGKTQKESAEALKKVGISQERIKDKSDDAVVVAQEPAYTMEVYEEKKVKTEGLPPDKLVHIEFFPEEAPKTVHYLRNITGLYQNYPIGKLQIKMCTDSLVLFRGGRKETIMHENLLSVGEEAEAGIVGVTNVSRPGYGTVGIRLVESNEFSPTGEHFESTNIVGVVRKGLARLKEEKREIIWFKDVTVTATPPSWA